MALQFRQRLYVSVICCTALVIYIIIDLSYVHQKNKTTGPGSVMRVGIGYSSSAKNLDPAVISTAFEYDLLQNLYGRLLRYDQQAQLVTDIPDSFSWSDAEVRFVFGQKVKTQSGQTIDAKDAEISLKRLVLQGRSGHGDIRRFLCPGFKMKSLEDDCPGIRTEGNTLVLRVVDPNFLPMLISTLESADYSIVPRSNINLITGELTNRSHRDTSGPYFVEKDSEDGQMVLAVNKLHYLYHPDMPQIIEVIPNPSGGPLQGFVDGKIDFLPTSAYFTGPLGKRLVMDHSNDVHETLPVSVSFMRFTPSAQREFSIEQRLYAGLVAGAAFTKHFSSLGGQPTEQFFQTFSDGTLDQTELETIRTLRSQLLKNPPVFSKPIGFGVPESEYETFERELRGVSAIKVIPTKEHPVTMKDSERPDMYYIMTDSAWSENLSLIGYNFESGTFKLPGLDPDRWFQSYISTGDKKERMALLRKLHFDILKNASIVPFEVAPYYAVASAGWKINQSKIMVGTELWAIRRN